MKTKTLLTAAAAAMWFLPVHTLLIALLAYVWVSAMMAAGTNAKTRSVEHRLGALVPSVALAAGFVNNGGTVGGAVTVNGNHTVNGGQTVGGTTATAGLAVNGTSWTQCGPQSTGSDGYGGGVWTSAQQTALLNLQSVANSSITALTNHGFMS